WRHEVGSSARHVREFRRTESFAEPRVSPNFGGATTMKRLSAVLLCLFAISVATLAKPAPKKSAPHAPDRAYLQKIWDGWSTLDPANAAMYYAGGPHAFFDLTPLKYGSWEKYEKGVKGVFAGYK